MALALKTRARSPALYTVALDSTLSFSGDSVIATRIASADLYDSHNSLVSRGQGSGTKWQFTLQGISSGDYFIAVNGIPISGPGSYPVVVRVDNPSGTITESVAQTLRNGVIQAGTTLYQFRTYSQGNGEPPIVKFSDTSNVTPLEWPYLVVSLAGSPHKLEVRALGTAALVNSYIASQDRSTQPRVRRLAPWRQQSLLGHKLSRGFRLQQLPRSYAEQAGDLLRRVMAQRMVLPMP